MSTRIPRHLAARTADMAVDFLSRAVEPRIHLVVDLDAELDADRLARALRLCLDAEPVFGCRFVRRWIRPYWRRLESGVLDRSRLLVEPPDQAQFLAADHELDAGPQVRAALLQGPRGPRLICKVNHLAADAGGTKEFGYLLASTYRELADHPGFAPAPNLGSRSLRQVVGPLLPRRFFGMLRCYLRDIRLSLRPVKSMVHPSGAEARGEPTFVLRTLEPDRVAAMKAHAQPLGATLNDLLITAHLRALARLTGWDRQGALRMMGTVDLRRFLPERRAQAIGNLSGLYFINLGTQLCRTFDDLLVRVKRHVDDQKADLFGLGFLFGNWLTNLPYPYSVSRWLFSKMVGRLNRAGNTPPSFTNMGPFDGGRLDFGGPRVQNAFLVAPPARPPHLLTGVTGFQGSLTLSTGAWESAIPGTDLEALVQAVDEELPGND